MNLIIKNGKIITYNKEVIADLLIKDGKIAEISPSIALSEEEKAKSEYEVIDAKGLFVLPGAVDAHTHFELPAMGTFSADNSETGSIAAAFGGVTTYIDYCAQEENKTIFEALDERRKGFEKRSVIDFNLHLTITHVDDQLINDLEGLKDYGISSVKLFTAYKHMMLDDKAFERVMEKAKEQGFLVTVHAEDQLEIDKNIDSLVEKNSLNPWNHYESRPEYVEAAAVERVIGMAKKMDSEVYFVHLSSKESLDLIKRAKREGVKVLAETCPQYLNFNNDVYKRADSENYICSPPIKGEESRKALWAGLIAEYIDTVATDHCPFKTAEKLWGKEDFRKAPNGVMGTENLYPYILSKANEGKISFSRAVELCSTNPARIFGCYPKKGTLTVGGDADIVIYDPGKKVTLKRENMHSNVDYTIWEGTEIIGYPIMTISKGNVICRDGTFLGTPGWGKFINCTRKNNKGEKK